MALKCPHKCLEISSLLYCILVYEMLFIGRCCLFSQGGCKSGDFLGVLKRWGSWSSPLESLAATAALVEGDREASTDLSAPGTPFKNVRGVLPQIRSWRDLRNAEGL